MPQDQVNLVVVDRWRSSFGANFLFGRAGGGGMRDARILLSFVFFFNVSHWRKQCHQEYTAGSKDGTLLRVVVVVVVVSLYFHQFTDSPTFPPGPKELSTKRDYFYKDTFSICSRRYTREKSVGQQIIPANTTRLASWRRK